MSAARAPAPRFGEGYCEIVKVGYLNPITDESPAHFTTGQVRKYGRHAGLAMSWTTTLCGLSPRKTNGHRWGLYRCEPGEVEPFCVVCKAIFERDERMPLARAIRDLGVAIRAFVLLRARVEARWRRRAAAAAP